MKNEKINIYREAIKKHGDGKTEENKNEIKDREHLVAFS